MKLPVFIGNFVLMALNLASFFPFISLKHLNPFKHHCAFRGMAHLALWLITLEAEVPISCTVLGLTTKMNFLFIKMRCSSLGSIIICGTSPQ